MPINSFNGDTFVAFLDISGFKEMMKGDGKTAIRALQKLNQAGYTVLSSHSQVAGVFISDCGVLFVQEIHLPKVEKLKSLLRVIKEINLSLIKDDIMTTTSIAYGDFQYEDRVEFSGISKNPIIGNAYLDAFIDNEKTTPKLEPGLCRIILDKNNDDIEGMNIPLLKKISKHYYYYWMVNDDRIIEVFERKYRDAYQLKYKGMLSALKEKHSID